MTKNEYLAALQRALADLPDDTTASVIADYAARFDAALAAGQSEEEVARAMPNPGTVASTWWSTARGTSNQSRFDVAAFTSTLPPTATRRPVPAGARAGQVISSAIGLTFLNLFMLIPAIVYTAVMGAVLVVALALYGGGIVVASSGLAGVDSVLLDTPAARIFSSSTNPDTGKPTLAGADITVSDGNIRIRDQGIPGGSVTVAHTNLDFLTIDGNEARPLRVAKGIALTVAAILILLIWLIVAKYSAIAARHYVALNVAVLRGR
jgi:uncharacterized membrane protein